MSVIDRLKRLSGESKSKADADPKQTQIGELRKRIEAIMERRPTPIIGAVPHRYAGQPAALGDLVPGDELDNALGRFYLAPAECKGSSFHGGRCIRDCTGVDMESAALIANDPLLGGFQLTDGLFLDTETTGLTGGTGTLAFLIGLGWFEGDSFVTRQIFARDFSEEAASLAHLADIARSKKFLITFNGKAFDIGLLTTRFILNRLTNPFTGMPHLDLLHPSRRLFGHRLGSSRLVSLEESILGFSRQDDVPGSEIPQRYFDWLKTRDGRLMADVFQHNRLDIVSMASLAAHLTELISEPVDLMKWNHADVLCAARLLCDRGRHPRAQSHLAGLIDSRNDFVKAESLRMLSLIHKRAGRWEEAVNLWEMMIDGDPRDGFALVELAKWCEHRLRDYERAQTLVEAAMEFAAGEKKQKSLLHRLNRLHRLRGINS